MRLPRRPLSRLTPRAALGASALGLLALVAVWIAAGRRPPEAELSERLVAAVGSQRYIEARVPGGFRFGPPPPRYRSAGVYDAASPAVLSVLADAEAAPISETPQGLLIRGIARLMVGRADEGLSFLSLAAAARPAPDTLTALSAAYLEVSSSKTDASIELAARAFDAAERALEYDDRVPEAWFNRALAASRLPPCSRALRVWDEYLAREDGGEWREEGRRLREETSRACASMRSSADLPGQVRARLEEEILPAWAEAWRAGRTIEAERLLASAESAASRVSGETGDRFASDLVKSIREARSPGRTRLAEAWMHYGRSRELFDRAADVKALGAAMAARRAAEPDAGPLSLLIGLQVATMALQQRQLDVAARECETVFSRAQALSYPGLAARVRIIRALVRTQQGRLSDAALEDRLAGEALERLDEPDLAAAAYGSLTSAMRRLNDARGTWAALARTLRVLEGVSSLRRRYVVLYNASLVAQSSGVLRAALNYQSAAVDVAERRGVAGAIVEAYTRRAQLRERLRPGSGASDLEAARRRAREVTDPSRARYYSALIDAVEGESLLASRPAAARDPFSRALEFFATYEPTEVPRLYLGRGRASRRSGDPAAARHDFLAGISAFERGRLRVSAENRPSYFDAARDLFDEMVALSDGNPDEAFGYAERGRALTVVEALGARVETDPERIAAQLPAGAAIVEYASLPDRLIVWVLTRAGRGHAVVAESRASLDRRATALVAAIAGQAGADDASGEAAALYDVLLRPVERYLRDARYVIVVGDGPIHRVPFALLRTSGRYLVERAAIVNALSASAFLAAERHASNAGPAEEALVVGNPSFDRQLFDRLRPLPASEREASVVAGMYPRATVLTRKEATRTRFVRAAAGSSVIHFGGHAVIDEDAPDRSALLLASGDPEGDVLTTSQIASLRLARAPIVVLAACSTATGAAYRLEGATSLSRAFLLAGASSVIGSLWDIEDDVSQAFFSRFHRRLAEGAAPADALRATQLELVRATDGRLQRPRAWAAFQLMGALSRVPLS